jgi:hypothetical protein
LAAPSFHEARGSSAATALETDMNKPKINEAIAAAKDRVFMTLFLLNL